MKVKIVQNILSLNDEVALANQLLFQQKGILVINIMASPGAGKTTFILNTLKRLPAQLKSAVIEGDIASSIDADKIKKEARVEAFQINTGGGCHLDANMISSACRHLVLEQVDLLFIENVGNLVCPAAFKLGEGMRLVIASVAEGDDKPIKYPQIFASADIVVISKTDLLPYINFNLASFKRVISGYNPKVVFFEVEATNGGGFDAWIEYLVERTLQIRSK